MRISPVHVSVYWPQDGSVPNISVSSRDGVAGCTTQSPESKGISGGRMCLHELSISSFLECVRAEGRRDAARKKKDTKG